MTRLKPHCTQPEEGALQKAIVRQEFLERALRQSELRSQALSAELYELRNTLVTQEDAINKLHHIGLLDLSEHDVTRICEEILNVAISSTHADKGHMKLYSRDTGKMEFIVSVGFGQAFLDHFNNAPPAHGVCGNAVLIGKRIIAEDVRQCEYLFDRKNLKVLLDEGICCMQTTPMYNSLGSLIGVLSTHHAQRHAFVEHELNMLDLLARLAADTIEHINAKQALSQSKQQALALVEELKNADRNKNEFIGMLSHEIRNPLAALVTALPMLELPSGGRQFTLSKQIVQRQVGQLCKLADDLLDVTRITKNKICLKQEVIGLDKIARDAARDVQTEFDQKGVRLTTRISQRPVFVYADPVRMAQIIGNLLYNALKFTPRGGAARLTLTCADGKAHLRVWDNGIGIEKELLPHLFTPFMQAQNSLDRSGGGLGLGLSIVKSIMDLHGAETMAYSDGPGMGSLFSIAMPLHRPERMAASERVEAETEKGLRVLVIEDNRDLSALLCMTFDHMGHKSASAHSGVQGLEKAREFNPDVIFCDVGLPVMNGYEVARRIKQDEKLKGIHLIALTGYSDSQDIHQALLSGFDRHLAKPVDLMTLNRVLAQIQKQ